MPSGWDIKVRRGHQTLAADVAGADDRAPGDTASWSTSPTGSTAPTASTVMPIPVSRIKLTKPNLDYWPVSPGH
jgi:hypothetical protein